MSKLTKLNFRKFFTVEKTWTVNHFGALAVLGVLVAAFVAAGIIIREARNFVLEEQMYQVHQKVNSDILVFKSGALHSEKTPEEVYESLRQALLNNDLEGALAQIHPDVRDRYKNSLTEAYNSGRLSLVAENLSDIEIESGDNYRAAYKTTRMNPNGESFNHYVIFVRDEKGGWKIETI